MDGHAYVTVAQIKVAPRWGQNPSACERSIYIRLSYHFTPPSCWNGNFCVQVIECDLA